MNHQGTKTPSVTNARCSPWNACRTTEQNQTEGGVQCAPSKPLTNCALILVYSKVLVALCLGGTRTPTEV